MKLYIYHSAIGAFNYYKEAQIIVLKNRTVSGEYHLNERVNYYNELINLNGKVWMLFSHVLSVENESEEKYMIELLLRMGAELLDEKKFKGSSVYYLNTKKLISE